MAHLVHSKLVAGERDQTAARPHSVGNRRWSPWGTALCDEVAEHADGGEAVLGPIMLSDYDADKRWKLRDKCLRVATYYRVMHICVNARGKRLLACVGCAGFFQGGQ